MLGQLEARLKMMSGESKQKALYKSNRPGARRQAISLAHLVWEHDFGHLETTMLDQLEARMKMMSAGSNRCSHHRFAGPNLALTSLQDPPNIAMLRPPRPSKTLPEGVWDLINQIALGQAGRAMGLAHLWWEHVLGHLEATILGQLGGRTKMMPGGPKLCSGPLTRRHGTIYEGWA